MIMTGSGHEIEWFIYLIVISSNAIINLLNNYNFSPYLKFVALEVA